MGLLELQRRLGAPDRKNLTTNLDILGKNEGVARVTARRKKENLHPNELRLEIIQAAQVFLDGQEQHTNRYDVINKEEAKNILSLYAIDQASDYDTFSSTLPPGAAYRRTTEVRRMAVAIAKNSVGKLEQLELTDLRKIAQTILKDEAKKAGKKELTREDTDNAIINERQRQAVRNIDLYAGLTTLVPKWNRRNLNNYQFGTNYITGTLKTDAPITYNDPLAFAQELIEDAFILARANRIASLFIHSQTNTGGTFTQSEGEKLARAILEKQIYKLAQIRGEQMVDPDSDMKNLIKRNTPQEKYAQIEGLGLIARALKLLSVQGRFFPRDGLSNTVTRLTQLAENQSNQPNTLAVVEDRLAQAKEILTVHGEELGIAHVEQVLEKTLQLQQRYAEGQIEKGDYELALANMVEQKIIKPGETNEFARHVESQ